MAGFDKSWARQQNPGMTTKLRDTFKPQGPLKPRIQHAVNKLQVQVTKMDGMLSKLQQRDSQLFQRIVQAEQQHDSNSSRVLANELAEVRKVGKMLGNARMALEKVQIRLTTIHDLGDAMVEIGPAMGTMKGLQSQLGKFMPEAGSEMSAMTETLNGLMTDSLSEHDFAADQGASSEETERILQEASALAEKQIGDRFPDVPTPTGLASQTTSTYE